MPETGTVKWFNVTKGFGFLAPDGGDSDLFFHVTELRGATVTTNDRVEFERGQDKRGRNVARNVRLSR